MKLTTTYNKLPNGNISAMVKVTDKGEYLTDKIFPDGSIDFSKLKEHMQYPLNDNGKEYIFITDTRENIEGNVNLLISIIVKEIKLWSDISIPDSKDYDINDLIRYIKENK